MQRFVLDNDRVIGDNVVETYQMNTLVDSSDDTFYFIVDSEDNVEILCSKLNKLQDELEQLKNLIDHKNEYINKLLYKPKLTDILPQAIEILAVSKELEIENDQLNADCKELRYANNIYCEKIDALKKENKEFKDKVFNFIRERETELEDDLARSVKAGMPTGLMYSELELLEDLKKELHLDDY